MIEIGEIVFCNLTILKKNVKTKLKEVVYKEKDGYYKGFKVIDIEVIKRLGFENKNKGFDLAVKNQEQRNNITGAYE